MICVARILFPVRVLGPGDRVGIWFDGCEHKCQGCSNPELWEQKKEYQVDSRVIMNAINRILDSHSIDGFTLTGGDPFFQPDALRTLIPLLRSVSDDILVYTGYKYEELMEKYPDILKDISALIDGPYIETRNTNCPLRGSDNQRIFYNSSDIEKKYEKYLEGYVNQIQNFTSRDGVISVGIHRPGYNEEIRKKLYCKGVLTDE